jgi:hypothetical protein
MNTRCVNAYNATPACCCAQLRPNDPKFQPYARPSTLNQQRNAVFFGGSLLASGEGFSKQVITKAQYREGSAAPARLAAGARGAALTNPFPTSLSAPPTRAEEEGPRCARSSMAFRFTS